MHRSPIALSFLIAAAAACGNPPGTGDPDARAPDAPGADAGPPNVTVTVYTYSGATAGLPVSFYEKDGTLDGVVTTDAAGKARAHIGAGASATVDLRPIGTPNSLTAFQSLLDLRPGDDVTIGTAYHDPGPSTSTTLTVTFPAQADAVFYDAVSDCGGGSGHVQQSPAVLYIPASCVDKTAKVTVIAHAIGHISGFDGNPIAYIAPVSKTMTTGSTIDLGGAAWTPVVVGTVSLTHVDEYKVLARRCTWAGCATMNGWVDNKSASLQVPVVPLGPTTLSVYASNPAENGAHYQYDWETRQLVQTIAADQGDVTIDASATLLPALKPVLDKPTHTLALTGAAGDLVRYEIDTSAGDWEMVAPPSSTLALPPLPQGVSYSLQPPGGGYAVPLGHADTIDLPDVTDWEAARPHAWDRAYEFHFDPVPGRRESTTITY